MAEQHQTPSHEEASTHLQQEKLYNDRWSGFGEQNGILRMMEKPAAAELKKLSLFAEFDTSFLEKISHDISIAVWKKGATLFEEGSYLDLAFFIIKGRVDVFVDKHRKQAPEPIFNSTFFDSEEPERPRVASQGVAASADPNQIMMLSSMDFNLAKGETMQLGSGELFGEIGSLNGWPQSVTAQTAEETSLIQIRLPALRELRKKSTTLKDRLDALYRQRALHSQLATTPLFKGIEKEVIQHLASHVELVSASPGELILEEQQAVDSLFMVRSGFVRLVQSVNEKPMTVSYLSKGMTYGEVELMIEGVQDARFGLESVGYSELVKIDTRALDQIVHQYPAVSRQLWDAAVHQIKETGHTRKHPEQADLIEFSLAKGLVQGNSMLVIDLDVCTRCDDCVTGCSNTHGGRPRFVREGEKYENFLIARSCYHCEDPVCLIGCPTGAIRRTNAAEVVAIEDDLCIGCSNCANKCPYDAIVMHDTGETWSQKAVPSWLRGRERKVASKCDLCYESDTGPACVNSCPHACAFRIGSLEEFQTLLATQGTPS